MDIEKYNVDIEPNEGDVVKVLQQILNVENIYLHFPASDYWLTLQ